MNTVNGLASVGVSGAYTFEVIDGATGLVKESGGFKNLITNNGLNWLGSGGAGTAAAGTEPNLYCSVGAGTTAPANANTALVSFISSSSNMVESGTITDPAPGFASTSAMTYEFPIGAVVGNISEIGIGPTPTGTLLFSRARVLDSASVPTTISVTSGDILKVTYLFTCLPLTTAMAGGTVVISGVSYTYAAKTAYAGNASPVSFLSNLGFSSALPSVFALSTNILGSIDLYPAFDDGGEQLPTVTPLAYVANSYQRTWVVTAGLAEGNFTGGIGSILIRPQAWCGVQIGFTGPKIPKTASNTLSLNLSISWVRV